MLETQPSSDVQCSEVNGWGSICCGNVRHFGSYPEATACVQSQGRPVAEQGHLAHEAHSFLTPSLYLRRPLGGLRKALLVLFGSYPLKAW